MNEGIITISHRHTLYVTFIGTDKDKVAVEGSCSTFILSNIEVSNIPVIPTDSGAKIRPSDNSSGHCLICQNIFV